MTTPARRTAGPGRHVYDAAVVGGQLPGALCAALLAKRGLQVLLVEHDGAASGYVHGDWRLPLEPFVMPPLKAVPALEEALAELGLGTAVHRAARPPAPMLQLLLPKVWMDLPGDPRARTKELTRALGKDGEAFEQLLTRASASGDTADAFVHAKPELPVEGLFAGWKQGRLLKRFTGLDADTPLSAQAPLERLLLGLLPLLGFADEPGPTSRARLLGKVLGGPLTFPGGRQGLTRAFAERARELGADVVGTEDVAHALAFEGSKPVGVRLGRSEQVYRAGFVVGASDARALAALVPEARRKTLDDAAARLEAKRLLFVHHVVLPEEALPRGLGELALLEAGDAELGTLVVQLFPARRATSDADSQGERVLTVAAPVPAGARAGGEPAVKALVAKLWGSLEAVLPFSRRHAVLESTPWLDAPRVADGTHEPHPLFVLPQDSALGLTGLALGGAYGRFALANRQVLPGLGLEGEAQVALRAAARVEHALKKQDPLKARRPTG